MTRAALALRVAVIVIGVLWWLPTIAMMFGAFAWQEVRLRRSTDCGEITCCDGKACAGLKHSTPLKRS